eukprot:8496962-Heterocapsa_arctica.AAC.1
MAIALSREHPFTHVPKDDRRKANKADIMAEIRAFGDPVNMDHLVSKNDVCAGIDDERLGMVILDHAEAWVETHLLVAAKANQ